jgi:hypothetical protein
VTDQPILRSRQGVAVAPAPRAAEADAQLDVVMRRAQTVARAGDAVPKGYRNNPGAVLLANEWAMARGLDLLTALQSVAFIDGKPVIDATMQRALAKQAGYRVKVEAADASQATVSVSEGGELLGSATYTIEEARSAGLTNKNNWKQHPKAMLVARATTQAMRWFAPDVMVGVFTDDEVDVDPVATLVTEPEQVEVADVVEAELVDDSPALAEVDGPASAATRGEAKAAVEAAKAAGTWPKVVEAMKAEGIPMNAASLTERQGIRLITLIAEVES